VKFVAGIDGGGTKCSLIIADMSGNMIYESMGESTNIYSNSTEYVKQNLKTLLNTAFNNCGLNITDCCSFCIGSAGIGREDDRATMLSIVKSIGFSHNIIVTNDAEIVLYAGTENGEGVVVISGTGSFAFGKNKEGKSKRAGGWGYNIGCEGGGYYIGIKAIQAVLRSYDGRQEYTELTQMIKEQIGIEQIDEIVKFINNTDNIKAISNLVKVVEIANNKHDRTANRILTDAANELTIMGEAVIKALEFESRPFSLVTGGNVLLKTDFIFDKFSLSIKEKYPLVNIKKLEKNAAWGAVLMALKAV